MNAEMSELDYERMLDTFRTASEWHGGQFSPLYSYSSTGRIHSSIHQEELLAEIEACQDSAERQGLDDVDVVALEHLRYTVECWPEEAV